MADIYIQMCAVPHRQKVPTTGTATIHAPTVWGALRALETLAQMIEYHPGGTPMGADGPWGSSVDARHQKEYTLYVHRPVTLSATLIGLGGAVGYLLGLSVVQLVLVLLQTNKHIEDPLFSYLSRCPTFKETFSQCGAKRSI